MRYEISLLGPFHVRRNGSDLNATGWPRRAGSLLRLLAVTPQRRRPREEIVDLFWPEASPETGGSNLRSAIQLLRQSLQAVEPYGVLSQKGWVALNPEYEWITDLDRFWEVARSIREAEPNDSVLAEAAGIYRGEMLPDDRYEDWAVALREDVKREWREICLTASEGLRSRDREEESVGWLRRQLDVEPLDEETLQRYIVHLGTLGRRTEALKAFHSFEVLLQSELDVEPEPATIATVAQLRAPFPVDQPTSELPTEDESRVPLDVTPRYRLSTDGPFTGREAELSRLLDTTSGAPTGRSRMLLISAEPGMGKTRLLAELTSRLQATLPLPPLILAGGAYLQEGRLPYGPIRDALADYILTQPESILAAQIEGLDSNLLRILPEIRERLVLSVDRGASPFDNSDQRLGLFWSVSRFLERISAARPVVLLLDDLQWADESTLQLLHFITRRPKDAAGESTWVVVGACRPDSSVIQALSSEAAKPRDPSESRAVQVIELQPLDLPEVKVLASELLEAAPSDELVRDLLGKSGGNPLFVSQMTALLQREGALELDAKGVRLATNGNAILPAAVRETILRRFIQMEHHVRSVLTLGAVFGPEFTLPAIEAAWDEPSEALLMGLEAGVDEQVLAETPEGFAFRHQLVSQALYENSSRTRRLFLHRRAFHALEQLYGSDAEKRAPELAFHLERAGPGFESVAIRYLSLAGDASVQAFAWTEAEGYYDRALKLAASEDVPAPCRVELQIAKGDVLSSQARFSEARNNYGLARDGISNAVQLAEVLERESVTWERQGENDRALEALDAAELCSRDTRLPEELVASLKLGRADVFIRRSEWQPAMAAAEEALASLPDGVTQAAGRAYHVLGAVAIHRGDLDAAETLHGRSLAVREMIGDPCGVAQSWTQLAQVAGLRGDLRTLEERHRNALDALQRVGDPDGIAAAWSLLGVAAGHRGHYVEAEECLKRSLSIREQIGDESRIADCWNELGLIAARRGALDEADDRLRRVRVSTTERSDRRQAGLWGAQGLVAFGRADYDAAEVWYGKSLELQERIGDRYGQTLGMVGLALVLQYRGDLDGAEDLYRASLDQHRRLGGRLWTAYATYGLGDLANERGDVATAMTLTRQARRVAHQLGLDDLEALAALAQARVFLRKGRIRAPEALIERARQLAADNNATKTSVEACLTMSEFRLHQNLAPESRTAADTGGRLARDHGLRREEGIAHRLSGQAALAEGNTEGATTRLRASVELLESIDARLELARSRVALARALHASDAGSSSQADHLLASARDTFAESGASADQAEAEELMLQEQTTPLS